MERADVTLSSLAIGEAKERYLLAEKGVSGTDIIEVWLAQPHYFINFTDRGAPYAMLGPNRRGRYLFVALVPLDAGTWRVVTAYWLKRRRAERLYGE